MGKLTKHKFKANTSSCYTYVTEKLDGGVEVIVDVASDEFSQVHTSVDIGGGIERRQLLGSYKIFSEEELKNDCKDHMPCPITIKI